MSKGKKGLSLLHVYARSNNVAEMIKLINNKENVNAKDSRKRTPLHLACHAGSLDAARLLIESGADVNATGMYGILPLSFAVMKNHVDIARLLLTNGAVSGINARFNPDEVTCLHIAARNNSKEMVKLLLEMGSDPNIRSKHFQRPVNLTTNDNIKKMITEYMGKWNDKKKEQLAEEREKKRLYHEMRAQEKNRSAAANKSAAANEATANEATTTNENPSKKLDLKNLASALDGSDYFVSCRNVISSQ